MPSRGILEYFEVTTEEREAALPAQPCRLNPLYPLVPTECGLAGMTVTIEDLGGFYSWRSGPFSDPYDVVTIYRQRWSRKD